MSKKTKTTPQRQRVSVSRINSILFECDGAMFQYCDDYISIWIDGDTSHHPDIELSVEVLNRIARIGDEHAQTLKVAG